ncbi:hypothetical protein LEP1GSC202_2002 [Leptospira yanagawae serovar Saopaulo str. Sao Paulo = ATCC 700523]|uniref:Uncharacterized protein n=1 Tax=Leptospira yanagawae serovar Saopaulo str. Sao Paulo = ATCC 700523 TaxID=1249483 RepID=A0A5E8HH29_9LEPT|nr:hypothetical protein LEP1GSC202_2002 [Leptospira yanagawae serovar Saopaulo str. Sao Paulo = ATCC 700523]
MIESKSIQKKRPTFVGLFDTFPLQTRGLCDEMIIFFRQP